MNKIQIDNVRYVFKHKVKNNILNVYKTLTNKEVDNYKQDGYILLAKQQYDFSRGWK